MLKYNSREALVKELNILKCCIANKAIELSNSIALGLGNVKCSLETLQLLQGYYDTLKCYYPYDCYTNSLDVETCGYIKVINEATDNIEIIENCIADEEAEKILRHAISFCDCCTEININNEINN